jgi:hypothetical protein
MRAKCLLFLFILCFVTPSAVADTVLLDEVLYPGPDLGVGPFVSVESGLVTESSGQIGIHFDAKPIADDLGLAILFFNVVDAAGNTITVHLGEGELAFLPYGDSLCPTLEECLGPFEYRAITANLPNFDLNFSVFANDGRDLQLDNIDAEMAAAVYTNPSAVSPNDRLGQTVVNHRSGNDVPEPASAATIVSGLACLILWKRTIGRIHPALRLRCRENSCSLR